jgi:1-acyl-sn-glycerol-3-phosphate acyltransferase
VAANHIDWLDGLVLVFALRPRALRFPARTNNYWLLGDYALKLDPKDPGLAVAQLEREVARGYTPVFFPEGQRNPGQTLVRGKTGCARLALLTGLPVVPIGLRGASHRSFGAAVRRFSKTLREVEVHIGQPISFPKTPADQIDRPLLLERTRVIMEDLAELSAKTYDPEAL